MVYRLVPLLMTLNDPYNADFKGTSLFDVEYLGNDTRYGHSYCTTSIGTRVPSVEWCHFQ